MRNHFVAAVVAATVVTAGSVPTANHSAASEPAEGQPGFSVSDFKLVTAQDLYDVCTVEPSNANYAVAQAFCYGFFSGGQHYHDEVASVADLGRIACPSVQPTRVEVVAVFVDFIKRNPQHAGDRPMNAVFEALGERWPCPAAP